MGEQDATRQDATGVEAVKSWLNCSKRSPHFRLTLVSIVEISVDDKLSIKSFSQARNKVDQLCEIREINKKLETNTLQVRIQLIRPS